MARSVWKGKFVDESLWSSMRRRLNQLKVSESLGSSGGVLPGSVSNSRATDVSAFGGKGVKGTKGGNKLGEDMLFQGDLSTLGKSTEGLYAGLGDNPEEALNNEGVVKNAEEVEPEEAVVEVSKHGGFRVVLRSGDSHLQAGALSSWSRSSSILPEWVGSGIYVYNGQNFHFISMKASMVGHKLGEYAPTRKAGSHLKKKKDKKNEKKTGAKK